MTREELLPIFQVGAPIKGAPTGVFDSEGNLMEQKPGEFIGRGLFEKDLESQGFTKSQLRKLCAVRTLELVTTRWQGGWRNTYVLAMPVAVDNDGNPLPYSSGDVQA